jgi:hypothetical protein
MGFKGSNSPEARPDIVKFLRCCAFHILTGLNDLKLLEREAIGTFGTAR